MPGYNIWLDEDGQVRTFLSTRRRVTGSIKKADLTRFLALRCGTPEGLCVDREARETMQALIDCEVFSISPQAKHAIAAAIKAVGTYDETDLSLKLAHILTTFGTASLRDQRQFLALVEDFHAGEEAKGDRLLLRVALEQGIGSALLSGPPSPAERKRMENRLTDLFIAPEHAARIVEQLERAIRAGKTQIARAKEREKEPENPKGVRGDPGKTGSAIQTADRLSARQILMQNLNALRMEQHRRGIPLKPLNLGNKTSNCSLGNGPTPGQDMEVDLPGGVQLALVWIAPGEFMMGSPRNEAGRIADREDPPTRVRLSKGYWLGKYPVTQSQWQALMGSNPSQIRGGGLHGGLNGPVEQVSWNDAMEFACKLTEEVRRAGRLPEGCIYILPSEAQWEYACRAGTTTRFNTGDSERDLYRAGWFSRNFSVGTNQVGRKEPNRWGLYDMHGNVWEWTRSWYGRYPGGSVTDYEGPESGSNRVNRGGCWGNIALSCRSASRNDWMPTIRNSNLGFRLALQAVQ